MRHNVILWPTPLYNIFPHYLINGTIFENMLLNTKCVFWFSLQLLSETFVILRIIQRDMIKNVYRSSCKVPVIVNKRVQLDATVCRHLFTAQSLYMFRVSQHPSSGVLKTVSVSSGIGHDTGTATSFQRGLIRPRWKEVAVSVSWPIPEAVDTVFSTPDDGCCDARNM